MNAGITAGALAAIVAVLASLPLKSPDDSLLNSASVGHRLPSRRPDLGAHVANAGINTEGRPKKFGVLWGVSSVTVGSMLLSAFAVQLDNLIPFALPLVVIVCTITGVLTPLFGRDPSPLRWWIAPAAVVVVLALAIPLANVGDEESGRLELPPKSGLVQPAPYMYFDSL